jgi:hypothetical protein
MSDVCADHKHLNEREQPLRLRDLNGMRAARRLPEMGSWSLRGLPTHKVWTGVAAGP